MGPLFKRGHRASLAGQWLRLRVSNASGAGLSPGQGTKIPWPKNKTLKRHLKTNNNNNNLRKRYLTVDSTILPTLLYYESALGLSQFGFRSGEWEESTAWWHL